MRRHKWVIAGDAHRPEFVVLYRCLHCSRVEARVPIPGFTLPDDLCVVR